MKLIDVHCHLESREFDGILDGVIADARAAGIVKLVTNAITPAQWEVSKALADEFREVEYALGIHPWYIEPAFEHDLPALPKAAECGAVAIGEIGLDAKGAGPPMDVQQRFFDAQLRVAKDLGLPVIVHCRGAFESLIGSVKAIGLSGRGGILHNYSGSAELARQLSRFNFYFSIGGTLTYRNSRKKQEVLDAIYPERFLLETDSPDIPPVEARSRPNVPANIVYNLRAAAEMLDTAEELVAERTTENAVRVLGLDLA